MRSTSAIGSVAVSFEPNVGQAPAEVTFMARGVSATITATGAVFNGGAEPVTLQFAGASRHARAAGVMEHPGRANYLIGGDPTHWKTNVPTFGSVRCERLYDGVDLVWYGKGRSLEYDLVVAPGANPNAISFELEGTPSPGLEADGALVAGDVRLERPFAYQEAADGRRPVASRYVVRESGRIAFELGEYDRAHTLVIDPEIGYTFDFADASKDIAVNGVAVDSTGAAYVVGSTKAAGTSVRDILVSKVNPEGTALVYSTTIGGSGGDQAFDVAVDAAGNAYVTGETTSANFPATAGAFQTAFASTNANDPDAFVLKLAADGTTLAYASYLGGSRFDNGRDIVIDGTGNAYLTGNTTSANFPTTEPAQAGNGGLADAFLTIINPSGSARIASTYLGGSESDNGEGIAIDGAGNVYVVGATFSANFPVTAGALQPTFGGGIIDGFWAKYDSTGQRVASTYLGGSGVDLARAVAADAAGTTYLTGETDVTGFPGSTSAVSKLAGGSRDAFVAELNPVGTSLQFLAIRGGSEYETGNGICLDSFGRVLVVGETYSIDLPLVDPVQPVFGGGLSDAFLLQCDPDASGPEAVTFCTYIGEERAEFGVDCGAGPADEVCVATNEPDLSQNGQENDEGRVTQVVFGPPEPRPDLEVSELDVGKLTTGDVERLSIVVSVVSTSECSGPAASDATIELEIPDGLGFFLADEPLFAPPIMIVESPAQTQSGKVIAKYAGTIPRDIDRALVRLLVVVTVPSTSHGTPLRIRASASTSVQECTMANNSLVLDLDTTKEQVVRSARLLRLKSTSLGTVPNIQLVNNLARSSSGGSTSRESQDVVGYNVYTSTQPNVQPVPVNLFAMLPPAQTSIDVSSTPAGSFFVVTTVTDDCESAPSNEVGGVLPEVTKLKVSASKIVAQGTGFDSSVQVLFGGLPFSTAAKLKRGNTKVIQKGALVTGQTIGSFSDQLLGQGGTVIILFVNGSGNAVAVEYTR